MTSPAGRAAGSARTRRTPPDRPPRPRDGPAGRRARNRAPRRPRPRRLRRWWIRRWWIRRCHARPPAGRRPRRSPSWPTTPTITNRMRGLCVVGERVPGGPGRSGARHRAPHRHPGPPPAHPRRRRPPTCTCPPGARARDGTHRGRVRRAVRPPDPPTRRRPPPAPRSRGRSGPAAPQRIPRDPSFAPARPASAPSPGAGPYPQAGQGRAKTGKGSGAAPSRSRPSGLSDTARN